jgi:hypothetical protein
VPLLFCGAGVWISWQPSGITLPDAVPPHSAARAAVVKNVLKLVEALVWVACSGVCSCCLSTQLDCVFVCLWFFINCKLCKPTEWIEKLLDGLVWSRWNQWIVACFEALSHHLLEGLLLLPSKKRLNKTVPPSVQVISSTKIFLSRGR